VTGNGTKPEKQDAPKPPDKTRRAAVIATVGTVAILGVAYFIAAVVVPVWQARQVVDEFHLLYYTRSALGATIPGRYADRKKEIAELGGPRQAARKLRLYLSLPRSIAPHRRAVVDLLSHCGPSAIPALRKVLNDPDESVRQAARDALKKIRGSEEPPPDAPAARAAP
jgi:hypothetical protein